jgi:DNA-binding transcriptional ArsR family regulator
VGHGTDESVEPDLEDEAVVGMAQTLHALGTPSRLRILLRLRQGPCTVGGLATAIDMEQSAVSHQLRVLRHLGLISGTREGKHISYRLYDGHVAQLLDEAIFHLEHLRLGAVDASLVDGE